MKILRSLLLLAYPLWVFAGLQWLAPRQVALGVLAVFALRALTRGRLPTAADLRALLPSAALVGGVLLATLASNDARFLLLVPALMNAALLLSFGRTLVGEGPPLVETFARLQGHDLSADEVAYCRSVTRVWCVFFAANAVVSLGLALHGDPAPWALYTGGVAYALVGLLFAVEFVVRAKRFGRYEGTLVEPLFRRLFPRDGTA
ncbi:MAG: hypothetical protein ACQGVC_13030 [Myxococcota bacterium]